MEEVGELSRAIQIFEKIRDTDNYEKENSLKILIEEETGDLFFALILSMEAGKLIINRIR